MYRCECNREFEKAQSLNAHYSHCLIHRNGKPEVSRGGWKISDEDRKKQRETFRKNIESGKTIHHFKGKHHSIETRQKLSEKMGERNNGYVKTKFYEVFCESMQKTVRVQGTWEFELTKRMDSLGIKWERDRKYVIAYEHEGIVKRYYPDFYLPDRKIYIEVKGFWFKSKDGRVDDRRKMDLVRMQNPEVTIFILDNIDKIREFE